MNRYRAYINSPEWRKVRARILKRSGGFCEHCEKRRAVQVHHKTYARLGKEKDSDLVALCLPCHSGEHPEKTPLPPCFLGMHQCRMCPCETAEIFLGDREIVYLCVACGEPESVQRRKQRRRQKRTKQDKPEDTAQQRHFDKQARQAARALKRAGMEIEKRHAKRSCWAF